MSREEVALQVIERSHQANLDRSKANAPSMKGEPLCRKCLHPNDRYEHGYAVCSGCMTVKTD